MDAVMHVIKAFFSVHMIRKADLRVEVGIEHKRSDSECRCAKQLLDCCAKYLHLKIILTLSQYCTVPSAFVYVSEISATLKSQYWYIQRLTAWNKNFFVSQKYTRHIRTLNDGRVYYMVNSACECPKRTSSQEARDRQLLQAGAIIVWESQSCRRGPSIEALPSEGRWVGRRSIAMMAWASQATGTYAESTPTFLHPKVYLKCLQMIPPWKARAKRWHFLWTLLFVSVKQMLIRFSG